MVIWFQDVECATGEVYNIKNFRNFYVDGTYTNNLASKCEKGELITDCESVKAGTDDDSRICYNCKYGQSVTSTGKACKAYTTDQNCRK